MIQVRFEEQRHIFPVQLQCEQTFAAAFESVILGSTDIPFEGPYLVTPKISSQTLNTQGCTMRENMTVNPIPYFEVSNLQAGKTAVIGGTGD